MDQPDLGILVVLAGFGLLNGALWARIVGVVLAVLVIITNFMWLPYYPLWSILVIATSVIVHLGNHGSRPRDGRVDRQPVSRRPRLGVPRRLRPDGRAERSE